MERGCRVLVIGAGAVGGYFGGRLRKAGHAVTFLARGRTAEALRAGGLIVHSVAGDFRVDVEVVETVDHLPPQDLVIVAVKSYDTADAAAALTGLPPGTPVLSLQNGIDNEAILMDAVGEASVLPGIAYIAAEREGPNVVRHRAAGRLAIGEASGAVTERVQRVAAMFEAAGVPCTVSRQIWRDKWAKLVWNATYNVFSVVSRATLDVIASDPEAARVTTAAMREVCAVAKAEGHELGDDVIDDARRLTQALGPARTSMLQDFEAGRRLELEALTGAVIRRGRKHGVGTPTLDALYACARLLAPGLV